MITPKILVLIAPNDTKPYISDLQTISVAKQLGQHIDVLIIGENSSEVAKQLANIDEINKIFIAESSDLRHRLSEQVSDIIVNFINSATQENSQKHTYTHVLANTSTIWKNILPRVAALLNVAQISDITSVIDANTFTRAIYAGNAIITVESSDYIKIISVRTSLFEPIAINDIAKQENQEKLVKLALAPINEPLSTYIKSYKSNESKIDLTTAKVVISGGYGFATKDNFDNKLIPLAKKFNAGVGASRAAVDSGFCANDCQVGQTGKTVAPDCYIAIGISGAIQHLCGMRDSKTIVAINKDKNAPICQIADYWLIGDLNVIIPELMEELMNEPTDESI